jgi:hypothetical protein
MASDPEPPAWEPEPLHAPVELPSAPRDDDDPDDEPAGVLVIDLA